MKRLAPPTTDDGIILTTIAGRKPLSDCPHITPDLAVVKDSYARYVQASGNATAPGAPVVQRLPGLLQPALERRYHSKTDALSHIEQIRMSSVNVCSMCGSPLAATVDHVFPRHPFPEFSIFSHNLVPACSSCNSGRQNSYCGLNAGERVLHPYFDTHLDNRLVQAKITPLRPDFRTATFDVIALPPETDPVYTSLKYHLENVVLKSGVIAWFITTWPNFQRQWGSFFQTLPAGAFTDAQFCDAVNVALKLTDDEYSTPNNWKSMLLAGLASNVAAISAFAQTIRDLRSGLLRKEDI